MEGTGAGKPQCRTSFGLPEGVYEVIGSFCGPSKHGTGQRQFKSSYARVPAMRQLGASPKPKSSLSLSLKSKKPAAAPSPSGSSRETVEFVAFPVGDSVCVCNLSHADTEKATRDKRFNQEATCCSINPLTSSGESLELLVGFDHGEVLLLDGITLSQTCKFNGGGALNQARVTDVKWLPGSHSQFVVAYANGVVLVLDSTKDDASSKSAAAVAVGDTGTGLEPNSLSVMRSKTQKSNPVSRWFIGKAAINHIAFSSPGAALISLSCQDGLARVLDYNTEKLIFSCRSQYGAVLCSAWSPDNEYIITGGEDDMVVVWSTHDKCAVARCLGHNSWLSDLAFDPMHCVTTSDSRAEMGSFLEGSNYRFVSVAQDGRMCVWDLNQGNLVRSRKRTGARRSSAAVGTESAARAALQNVADVGRPEETSSMEPVCNALVSQQPLSMVHVAQSMLITTSFAAEVQVWGRPPANARSGAAGQRDADDD